MTETPARSRRWVTWTGLVFAVAGVFGGQHVRVDVCQVCRTHVETTTWGLTLGDSIGVPVWRTVAETPCEPVQRFLGASHEHGAAMTRMHAFGQGLLMSMRTWCGWRGRAVAWTGLGAQIEASPALADAFAARIAAGEISESEMREALGVLLFDPGSSRRPKTTVEQRALLRRMATIIADDQGLPPRNVTLGMETDIWADVQR